MDNLFKLFMSLECNYSKLQFKNWLHGRVQIYVHMNLYICKKNLQQKTIQEWLLSLEIKGSESYFQMNCHEGLEAMLFGRVLKKLAIFDIYFILVHVTGSTEVVFITNW